MATGSVGQHDVEDNPACLNEWRPCSNGKLANALIVDCISVQRISQKLTTSSPKHVVDMMGITTGSFFMLIVTTRKLLKMRNSNS